MGSEMCIRDSFSTMFSLLGSRGNGGYYDLKHVEIECKFGLEIVFSLQNNLKGADWSIHIFVHSATAMALNKNPAMSPSSSVHCGQYNTTCTTIGCVLRKAFADDKILGVHREPACKVFQNIDEKASISIFFSIYSKKDARHYR